MHHMPYGGYPPQHPTSGLTKEGSDHGDIGGGVGWPPYPPPHDPSGGLDGVGPPGTGGGGNPSFYPGDGSGSEAGSAAGGSSGASKKTKRGRKKRNRIPPPMHSGMRLPAKRQPNLLGLRLVYLHFRVRRDSGLGLDFSYFSVQISHLGLGK